MTCLAPEVVARLATDDVDHAHLAECIACRGAVQRQRELRARLVRATPVALPTDERAQLIARIAIAGRTARATGGRRSWIAIAAVAVAAAAAIAVPMLRADPELRAPVLALAVAPEPVAMHRARAAVDDPPPALAPPVAVARDGARVRHATIAGREVFELVDGELEVDSRHARDAEVVVGALHVGVDDARVRVRARAGAVTSVQVVLGSAQLVGPNLRATLARDSIWEPVAGADARAASAFEAGWLALRDGKDREAIALFDRATDPALVEEAAYWAAVAAQRAGDRDDAARRFTRFLADHASSPYAARATRALASLAH